MIDKSGNIFVAGGYGLVGKAVFAELNRLGHTCTVASSKVLDLTDYGATERFFGRHDVKYVVLCAAKVGGIVANRDNPVDFIDINMLIELNVMRAAFECGVKKLLFTGSACAYPKHAPVPLKEEYLLTGPLEPTNKGYALSKILGHELCKAYRAQHGCNFISCIPTNIYGPGDHYDAENSHVIPGMMLKLHKAKKECQNIVDLWGTGTPRREFLYVDDLAKAIVTLMYYYDGAEPINVGYGQSIQLSDVAEIIRERVGYPGLINWDETKPDGTPNRLLDSSKIFSLGWEPKFDLERGLAYTYDDFLKRHV